MPISLTNVLKWGGSLVTIIFAVALIMEMSALGPMASAPNTTLYIVLMVAGLAAATTGWLLDRRKGSAGSESADSESSDS